MMMMLLLPFGVHANGMTEKPSARTRTFNGAWRRRAVAINSFQSKTRQTLEAIIARCHICGPMRQEGEPKLKMARKMYGQEKCLTFDAFLRIPKRGVTLAGGAEERAVTRI